MTENLKSCPFCGDPKPTFTGYEDHLFVMCGNCGADVDSLNCDGDVRVAWNRRAASPAPQATGALREPAAWQVAASFWGKFESIPEALRAEAIPLYALSSAKRETDD